MRSIKYNVIVMEIQTKRDVEFFANGEEVVDRPGDVVVFEHYTSLDRWRKSLIIFTKSIKCGGFIAECATQMEDQHSVPVFLGWEFEERKEFIVIF